MRKNLKMKKNKLISGKWMLKGGKIYDPYKDKFLKGDILLNNGKIEKIGSVKEKDINLIDCSNKIIAPGFTDIRSHFKQPGSGYVETLESGIDAAMAGGYTTVCLMSDKDNPLDTPEAIKSISEINNKINILPIGSASVKHDGVELCEYGCMVKEGAVAFSDSTSTIKNSQFLKYALEYSGMYDAPLISFSRDLGLSEGGVVNEGFVSTKLGLQGIPDISESIVVSRDLMIAELTGKGIHVPLVSTSKSIDIIKEYQDKGVMVTADVSPHHIFFNDDKISNYNSNAKVYPPLRSEKNREALIAAIKNNVITSISSDHTPCSSEDKEKDIAHASFGTISLESAFSLAYTVLTQEGFSIAEVIKLFTKGPRKALALCENPIDVGSDADFVIIDSKKRWTFNDSDIYSKSKNSIALGVELTGKVDLTIYKKNAFGLI